MLKLCYYVISSVAARWAMQTGSPDEKNTSFNS